MHQLLFYDTEVVQIVENIPGERQEAIYRCIVNAMAVD